MEPAVNPPANKARLRWCCRRGMKELDMLLERYLDQRFAIASAAEQALFLQLLDCEDPDLWSWVIGHAEPPAKFSDVLQRLLGNA